MDTVETGKVDAKGRQVFKDSKGRTHVKQGDKKVYVKKLFTPKRSSVPLANTRAKDPVIPPRAKDPVIRASSPMINTGKVNAKKRQVFKDSKDRTYVKQDGKKVYVKKLFTPQRAQPPVVRAQPPVVRAQPPVINTDKAIVKKRKIFKVSKGREKQAVIPRESPIKTMPVPIPYVPKPYILSRIKLDCSTPAGLSQTVNTCWFNASLNGFILAEATARMIFDQIKLSSSSEIAALERDFPTDSCPITLSRKYVFHYFLKIHSGTPITGIKGNISVDLINKMFTPKALSTPSARGDVGAQPSEAAKRILTKVFTPGETGMSLTWLTTVRSEFSKYTMVYREGSYARKKWAPPDMHPLVIKTVDGKTKFNLSHMVYVIKRMIGYHAAVAYVCGGKKYLYDSNKRQNLEIDWSNPENRKEILRYSGAVDFEYVSYTLYVRE
jgi:hypothetical protein